MTKFDADIFSPKLFSSFHFISCFRLQISHHSLDFLLYFLFCKIQVVDTLVLTQNHSRLQVTCSTAQTIDSQTNEGFTHTIILPNFTVYLSHSRLNFLIRYDFDFLLVFPFPAALIIQLRLERVARGWAGGENVRPDNRRPNRAPFQIDFLANRGRHISNIQT